MQSSAPLQIHTVYCNIILIKKKYRDRPNLIADFILVMTAFVRSRSHTFTPTSTTMKSPPQRAQCADFQTCSRESLSLTIAHPDGPSPWPMSLFWEFSNSGPTEQIQSLSEFLQTTFDIGLGEQHKLNCLQQRGIRKTSWDGVGKYTEFYPVIGTITSNTCNCDLCCSIKDMHLSRSLLQGHMQS